MPEVDTNHQKSSREEEWTREEIHRSLVLTKPLSLSASLVACPECKKFWTAILLLPQQQHAANCGLKRAVRSQLYTSPYRHNFTFL